MKKSTPSKTSKVDVQPRDFVRQLFQDLKGASNKARWLKVNGDQETIIRVTKALPRFPHPLTQHFFGTPWQHGLTGLFKKRPQQSLYSASLISELQWTTATIASFSSELNTFYKLKQKCECEFLRGEFSTAENSHQEIESLFGVSLWSLQQRFLLLEYTNGLESNTKYLSELNSKKDLHFFIQVMVTFLSMRAERQLSYDNYQHKLSKYLSSYDAYPKLKSFFEHLTGRDGMQFDVRDEDLMLWLLADGSLIDRCLYTMLLIQRLLIARLPNSDLVNLHSCIKLICDKLTTSAARNISLAVFPSLAVRKDAVDLKVISAYDRYTEGDYAGAAAMSAELLFQLPTSIQLFVLYAKSLIFSGKPFKSPFDTQAPAHDVLYAVDSVFRKTNNYTQAIESLSRYAKSYHHTPLATGLHYLITEERNPKQSRRWEQLTLLDSQFLDPKIYTILDDSPAQLRILNQLKEDFPDSLTVAFLSSFKTNSDPTSTISFPNGLSIERKLRYTATALLQRNDFQGAIPLLEKLYAGHNSGSISTLTAMWDPELNAVLELPLDWHKRTIANDGTTYFVGTPKNRTPNLQVVAASCSQMGMAAAAVLSAKMINHFRPRYLVIAGIAAGIKVAGVNLGDILIAEQSWDYESGKRRLDQKGKPILVPDPHHIPINSELRDQFAGCIGRKAYIAEIEKCWTGSKPFSPLNAVLGPVGCGAAVVEDENVVAAVKDHARKLIGIDMETYGIFYTGENCCKPRPKVFAIKSVVDFADDKKNDSAHEYAAFTSAQYLWRFAIEHLPK